MKIDHVALWTYDLERSKDFYQKYFQAEAGEKYLNPNKNFQSYFLTFQEGCRLEVMQMPGVVALDRKEKQHTGLTHLAISVGEKSIVNLLTERLRNDGYEIVGEPRTTGDGYYESVVQDPDGNRIEITI